MTAVTEILNHCNKLLSEGHQIDTQGLIHWIEDKLLEMEKEQIINSFVDGADKGEMFNNENRAFTTDAEQYYNETFKSE